MKPYADVLSLELQSYVTKLSMFQQVLRETALKINSPSPQSPVPYQNLEGQVSQVPAGPYFEGTSSSSSFPHLQLSGFQEPPAGFTIPGGSLGNHTLQIDAL